jgi:hypothetical protein
VVVEELGIETYFCLQLMKKVNEKGQKIQNFINKLKFNMSKLILIASLLVGSAFAGFTESKNGTLMSSSFYGVDVSVPINAAAAECFKSKGLTYIVPRGYRSTGAVDLNVCDTLNNAAAAGIETRDVYIFPCKL